MSSLSETFRALKYRNFRLFFPGLAISQIGIWVQNVAISWLVYDITKSPLMLGTITFLNTVPLLAFAPFAGVIIDKFNRHKLLMLVQILFAFQALLMTLVMFLHLEHLSVIVLLGVFLNTVASFDVPLRQSTFVCLVEDKKDLSNAISLNSSCFNIAKLLGPAIAGLLIVYTSIKVCFLVNFLCLLPMIYLVKLMKFEDKKAENVKNTGVMEGLKEGFSYSVKKPQILFPLLFVAVFSLIGMSYPILIPMYTKDVLSSNADTLGFLMAMAGIGALFASLSLAAQNSLRKIKRKLRLGTAIFSISYIIIGLTKTPLIALIAMLGVGLGTIFTITSNLTLIQSYVENSKRGRVMSIYAICLMGTTSLSNFAAGSLAEFFGISNAFIFLAILMFLVAAALNWRIARLIF